jgi:hypothetical protein
MPRPQSRGLHHREMGLSTAVQKLAQACDDCNQRRHVCHRVPGVRTTALAVHVRRVLPVTSSSWTKKCPDKPGIRTPLLLSHIEGREEHAAYLIGLSESMRHALLRVLALTKFESYRFFLPRSGSGVENKRCAGYCRMNSIDLAAGAFSHSSYWCSCRMTTMRRSSPGL